MLNTQKYLFSFPTIQEGIENLKTKYHIIVKEYDDLYCLKYNQIESIKTDPIVKECRGLILDKCGNIVCRPFDRFFNYGEANNTDFDFSNATVVEKIDGSLIKVYYHYEKWYAGTSGTAYAEADCSAGYPFINLIERVIGASVNEFMTDLFTNSEEYTFLFELTTPENRVVKSYTKDGLYLIGIRHNITGEYLPYNDLFWINEFCFDHSNVKLPQKYPLNSFEEIKDMFDNIGEMDEGFVCWNEKTGERVKCKSPSYIHFHHLRDNGVLNPKRISELAYLQDYEEYLNAFPEDKKYFLPYILAYSTLILEINSVYDKYKDIENQKDFAMNISKYPFKAILFQMRKGFDLYKCLKSLTSDKKLQLLEKYM